MMVDGGMLDLTGFCRSDVAHIPTRCAAGSGFRTDPRRHRAPHLKRQQKGTSNAKWLFCVNASFKYTHLLTDSLPNRFNVLIVQLIEQCTENVQVRVRIGSSNYIR